MKRFVTDENVKRPKQRHYKRDERIIMIVEHRTYKFQPGLLQTWLAKYESEGLPIQKKHLGRFLGLWVTEIGEMHQTVMMWAYDSLADCETRRAAMESDPDWKRYIAEIWKMETIRAQEVKILKQGIPL